MERDIMYSNELTGQAQSAYSNSGGIYMPDGSSGPGPESANPGRRPSSESELTPEERKQARDSAREEHKNLNQQVPSEDASPEEIADFTSRVFDVERRAGYRGSMVWDNGQQRQRINGLGFYGTSPEGREHIQAVIEGTDYQTPVPVDELVYQEDEDGEVPEVAPVEEGESPAPVEIGEGDERGDDEGEREDEKDEAEKATLMSRVKKVALAKTALLKGNKEGEVIDPMTGRPMEGTADEIIDYLDSVLSEAYKELAEKYPDAYEEKELSEDFLRNLLKHLANENVQEQLRSLKPEFTSTEGHKLKEGVDDFGKFIEGLEIGKELLQFAHIISLKSIDISSFSEKKNGKIEPIMPDGKTINLSPEARKLLFEWALNKVITIPLADEDSPYQLSLQHQNIRDELKALAQTQFKDKGDKEFHNAISTNASVEGTYHNVNIAISSGGEKYQELYASLRTPSLSYITNEIAGVSEVLSQLDMSFIDEAGKSDQAMSVARAKRAYKDAEDKIRELHKVGELKVEGRVLNEWEIERAIRIAETHFRASQRGAVYSSLGDMEGVYESFPDEYAVRMMAPSKTLWKRFWSPGDEKKHNENKPAAKALYKKTIEKMGEQWETWREESKKKKKNGQSDQKGIGSLIGQSRDEMLRNSLGIFDIASHSGVRGPKLFLSPIKMEDGEGGSISMYEYLKSNKMTEASFSELKEIETRVLGQTSYLSALNRSHSLSTELRQKLWRKRAIIDPTAVVSLRPKEIMSSLEDDEEAIWKQLKPILDQHHVLSLSDEKIKYSGVLTKKEMQEEAAKFRGDISSNPDEVDDTRDKMINDEKFNKLLDRLIDKETKEDGSPLSLEEKDAKKKEMKRVLTKVICLGMEEADELAVITVHTKHSYAINDAPITAWYDEGEGLADNNFVRNFGDQAKIHRGFETWGTVFDDIKTGVSGEPFDQAVKELGAVYGEGPARDIVQGSWQAFLEMASQYEFTKWNPAYFVHDKMGKPRSDFEKYLGRLGVFMNEFEKKAWLETRANNGTIENDLRKDRKDRQLTKALNEAGAGRRGMAVGNFREGFVKVWPLAITIALILEAFLVFKNALSESAKEI